MKQTKTFQKEKVKRNQKILIYGAAVYGEIALRGLEILGLKAECFVDREHAGETYFGLNIISPEELKNYRNAVVIIASLNYYGEILEYLKKLDMHEYYDMEEIMQLNFENSELTEYAWEEIAHFQKYKTMIENYKQDYFIINHCEIVVTEKCTLRCRDCANLMQHYERPENIDSQEIIQTFNRFLDVIDVLCELRILGGEPFIYKELDLLLAEFVQKGKIKKITIYTNATVLPDKNLLEILKNKKIAVHLSDYGLYSRKIQQLADLFDKNEVIFYVHRYEKWRDFGDLEKRNYSQDQLNKLFKTCVSGKCYTFYRGKFYLCPRAAHGERLGIFQNKVNEFIDFSEDDIDRNNKREELGNLLTNICSLTACDYCNGESVYSKEIDAAVQINK